MMHFSTRGTRDEITEWLRANCIGGWEISAGMNGGQGPLIDIMVSLESDEDAMLYDLRWHTKQVDVRQLTDITEPVFSVEELEAAPDTIAARTYFAGADYYDWVNRDKGAIFGDQMVDWCRENLSEAVLVSKRQNGVMVGVPEEDDRVLFMMKWEGHPMVKASTWQWASDDV